MDAALIDRGNLRKSVNGLFSCGMSLITNLVQKLQRQKIWCKGDQEEEITQFDGETVKKMMINETSTFPSNVDNVKISPEGFDSEVSRTVSRARMRFRTHC